MRAVADDLDNLLHRIFRCGQRSDGGLADGDDTLDAFDDALEPVERVVEIVELLLKVSSGPSSPLMELSSA